MPQIQRFQRLIGKKPGGTLGYFVLFKVHMKRKFLLSYLKEQ